MVERLFRELKPEMTILVEKEFTWSFSVVNVLLGIISLPIAMMSPMGCGAPGACSNIFAAALFVAVFTFPLVCLLSVVVGWLLYAKGRVEAASIVLRLPRYELLAFALLLLVSLTIWLLTGVAEIFLSAN